MKSIEDDSNRIHYNKLVRDEIPRIIRENGKLFHTRKLSQGEFKQKLIEKLKEELQEFIDKPSVEELADMLEVIHALAAMLGSSINEIDSNRVKKRSERGAFDKKILLEWVEEAPSKE